MVLISLYHQVVLEGQWQEGFMALAAIGATNIGSIEVESPSFGFKLFIYLFIKPYL